MSPKAPTRRCSRLCEEFSEDEWDRLNAWLDRIYDDFTAKVADWTWTCAGTVQEVARGRVWTGADAKQYGLVDELGGLRTAIELAAERAGLPSAVDIEPRLYPRVPMLARLRPARSSEDPAAASARLGFEAWGPFADLAIRPRPVELRAADAPDHAAVRPLRTAQVATSVRLVMPSLVRMLETWTAAVRGEM